MLKSDLGGIEIEEGHGVEAVYSLLKSDLGGIEMGMPFLIAYSLEVVKIRPWRD